MKTRHSGAVRAGRSNSRPVSSGISPLHGTSLAEHFIVADAWRFSRDGAFPSLRLLSRTGPALSAFRCLPAEPAGTKSAACPPHHFLSQCFLARHVLLRHVLVWILSLLAGTRPLCWPLAPGQDHARCSRGAAFALLAALWLRHGGKPRAAHRAGQPLAISSGSPFQCCAKGPARRRRRGKSRCPRRRPARYGRSGGHRTPPLREARN